MAFGLVSSTACSECSCHTGTWRIAAIACSYAFNLLSGVVVIEVLNCRSIAQFELNRLDARYERLVASHDTLE